MAIFDDIPEYNSNAEQRKKPRPAEHVVQGYECGTGAATTVIDPATVWKMALIGCTDEEIAQWFGTTTNTLRYNFKQHMARARVSLKQRLRKKQIDVALSGNATMLIWLGKNYLDQSDNPENARGNDPLPWIEDEATSTQLGE